jgi:serine/threonine protein kinase/Tol biopolymer transport system component
MEPGPPDRRQKLEQLFFNALDLEGDERAAFLQQACADDEALRQELESLLTWGTHPAQQLLGKHASLVMANGLTPEPLVGRQLGIYTITSLIGAGGMGEVYQAHDTKLGREVAIKVLPPSFVDDAGLLARFQREAQMLAALNHRNIAVIHGLEQVGETHFLVMELVQGETLAERIAREGILPLKDALNISQQIAEALEAAHEKRIIHRDLKPANIKVTPEGDVKVLDFGLAKSADYDSALSSAGGTTTESGLILGTPAYMSPEQAHGKPVDKRTDIWAFGCVLYELLTAKRPFAGETPSARIAALLEREPEWNALPPSTPIRLRDLLQRCLQKDPRDRLRDVGDARIEIERLRRDDTTAISRQLIGDIRWRVLRKRLAWVAGAVLLSVALSVAYQSMRSTGLSDQTVRSEILPPDGSAFGSLALSPDGRQLAFVAVQQGKKQLWVRAMPTAAQRPLAGTDGAAHPFWSADSLQLGFFADGKLKRIPAGGGTVQVLADAPASLGGAWNEDGVIVFAPGGNTPLYRVPSTGGPSKPLTHLDASDREVSHRWPSFLPGGTQLLYFSMSAQPGANGVGNTGTLFAGSLDGAIRKRLLVGAYGAHYTSRGYIAFERGGLLLAQRFRLRTLALEGPDLITLSDDIQIGPVLEGPPFGVSDSGDVLVYRRRGQANAAQRDLRWFARDGSQISAVGPPDRFWSARLSPDGRFVAAEIEDPETRSNNIWVIDTTNSARTRLTFSPTPDANAVWSPDSQSIVFGSRRQGQHFSLFRKPSNGSGGEQPLYQAAGDVFAEDWSRDGRFLLYTLVDPSDKPGGSIWMLPMRESAKPRLLLRSAADDRYPHFSPNGRWVAYRSNESARNQIYVIPSGDAGGKWQISSAGGDLPVWRNDGQELYFLSPDGELMAAGVREEGPTFTFTAPKVLFKLNVLGGYGERFAATDGRRFLALVNKDEAPRPLSAVIRWSAASK